MIRLGARRGQPGGFVNIRWSGASGWVWGTYYRVSWAPLWLRVLLDSKRGG